MGGEHRPRTCGRAGIDTARLAALLFGVSDRFGLAVSGVARPGAAWPTVTPGTTTAPHREGFM